MKSATLWEVSLTRKITSEFCGEMLKEIFVAAGAPYARLAESETGGRVSVAVYEDSCPRARRLCSRLTALPLKKVRCRVKRLERADWRDAWKTDLRPFPLTEFFDVVPLWHKKHYRPAKHRQAILMDTTLAFGTGLHPTTKCMALLIERCRGRFTSFLDIGTGTGILAVVAAKCGACEITVMDIQEESVRVAEQNFLRNGCQVGRIFHMDFTVYKKDRPFQFVAANLVSHDLKNFSRKLFRCVEPGGRLAVSGISSDHLENVKAAFRPLALRTARVLKNGGWAAILYRRKGGARS